MRKIKLTRGKYALVDDEDFRLLSGFRWQARRAGRGSESFYASTGAYSKGKTRTVLMHSVILWKPPHLVIDHINGNGLDNRRKNLRIVTQQVNCLNQKRLHSRNKSGFRGVSLHKLTGKWVAAKMIRGKQIHIGLFDTPEEASKAFKKVDKQFRQNL